MVIFILDIFKTIGETLLHWLVNVIIMIPKYILFIFCLVFIVVMFWFWFELNFIYDISPIKLLLIRLLLIGVITVASLFVFHYIVKLIIVKRQKSIYEKNVIQQHKSDETAVLDIVRSLVDSESHGCPSLWLSIESMLQSNVVLSLTMANYIVMTNMVDEDQSIMSLFGYSLPYFLFIDKVNYNIYIQQSFFDGNGFVTFDDSLLLDDEHFNNHSGLGYCFNICDIDVTMYEMIYVSNIKIYNIFNKLKSVNIIDLKPYSLNEEDVESFIVYSK